MARSGEARIERSVDEEEMADWKKKKAAERNKSDPVTIHARIVKKEWAKLSSEDQREWEDTAKDQHAKAVKEWGDALEKPYSKDPADRQR